MQWTDQIRRVKILLVVAAVLIAVASLLVSHYLVRDLSIEERNKMGVWAEAMRSLNNADETTDLTLVWTVLNSNNTIPVVVLDSEGRVQDYRNMEVGATSGASLDSLVLYEALSMKQAGRTIRINFGISASHHNSNSAYRWGQSPDAG